MEVTGFFSVASLMTGFSEVGLFLRPIPQLAFLQAVLTSRNYLSTLKFDF